MIGDLVYVEGYWRRVVSETPITVSVQETEQEAQARERSGQPAQTFQYMAVKTEPVPWQEPEEEPDEDRIVTVTI